MLTPNLRKYFPILLSALWVFACSHIGIQSQKEEVTSDLLPDCQRNWSKERTLISRPIYKTWVKYDQLDFKKGFDLAVKTLQAHGY